MISTVSNFVEFEYNMITFWLSGCKRMKGLSGECALCYLLLLYDATRDQTFEVDEKQAVTYMKICD